MEGKKERKFTESELVTSKEEGSGGSRKNAGRTKVGRTRKRKAGDRRYLVLAG